MKFKLIDTFINIYCALYIRLAINYRKSNYFCFPFNLTYQLKQFGVEDFRNLRKLVSKVGISVQLIFSNEVSLGEYCSLFLLWVGFFLLKINPFYRIPADLQNILLLNELLLLLHLLLCWRPQLIFVLPGIINGTVGAYMAIIIHSFLQYICSCLSLFLKYKEHFSASTAFAALSRFPIIFLLLDRVVFIFSTFA